MTPVYEMKMTPVTAVSNDQKAATVLNRALKEVGFIPNMYACMVNFPALLDTYLHGYRLFRQESLFTPQEQEVVFLTVSRVNECHYCVAAHSMLADKMSNVPAHVLKAIRNGTNIEDHKLGGLAAFTRKMVESGGRPNPVDVDAFIAVGYTERHILDIILAIGIKTLSNYSNHLFHTPVDERFKGYSWNGPMQV